jgi:hypothetical protein
MPEFAYTKLIIVLSFLGILLLAQFVIKRWNIFGTILPERSKGAIKLTGGLELSKFASASVIECADVAFLVITGKNGSSSIVELPATGQGSELAGSNRKTNL